MTASSHPSYYPICLALTGKPCLVVGGGRVAQQKAQTLLQYGATVTVVAPTLTPVLRRWALAHRVRWRKRRFRPTDVARQRLVYGATDDPHTQAAICRAAERRRIPVNIVDAPARCTFIAPAQLKRGALTIAVTTGGRSPILAKRVRQEIEQVIGPEYGQLLRILERARPVIRRAVPTVAGRKRIFERLIRSGLLDQLRRGRQRQAQRTAMRLLQEYTRHSMR